MPYVAGFKHEYVIHQLCWFFTTRVYSHILSKDVVISYDDPFVGLAKISLVFWLGADRTKGFKSVVVTNQGISGDITKSANVITVTQFHTIADHSGRVYVVCFVHRVQVFILRIIGKGAVTTT
jgi:hypothetical protein